MYSVLREVLFATGNSRKIKEASDTLNPLGITVTPVSVSTDEIQHHDPKEITNAKARAAYEALGKSVVVQDTSWEIPALGGFPGGYMKDVSNWFAPEDWVALMARHEDKTIYCHEHIAYYDGEQLQHFSHRYEGKFVDSPRGTVAEDESFEALVVLYGDKTMAEQLESGDIASAGDVLEHWQQFGDWYTSNR